MRTPWGDGERLRSRMLRPGPGVPREVVERNQRDRLFAATVAVVARRGYEAMTVADLVAASGVSRSTFYEHFANKEDCFLAAFDEIVEGALATVAQALRERGPEEDRLRAALDEVVALVVDQPAAARMCFVDIYAAGAAGADRVEHAMGRVERMVRHALRRSPERAGMPRELILAIIGGLRKVIQTRLRLGHHDELVALVPELAAWATSYRAPPMRLRRPRRRALPPGRSRYVPHDPVERIISAVATTVVEKGYPDMTVADIVRTASTSLSTFYAHFRNKEDALLAAFDTVQAQTLAATTPAYNRAPDWPHAVRAGLYALLAYNSVESAFAYLGNVGMYAAGLRALARRDAALEVFQAALAPGYEQAPGTSPIAAEAIGGAIYALIYDHVLRRGAENLTELSPMVTFLALTPFIGVEAACAVANEGGASGRRGRGARTGSRVKSARRSA